MIEVKPYKPKNKVRIVTAASLFDGHDAAINIMRRIIQSSGCEVIHLGHDRSVKEIVDCAIEEDANAIALTSYQGGHNEFLKYMFDLLKENSSEHIKIIAGGGIYSIRDLNDYKISGADHYSLSTVLLNPFKTVKIINYMSQYQQLNLDHNI